MSDEAEKDTSNQKSDKLGEKMCLELGIMCLLCLSIQRAQKFKVQFCKVVKNKPCKRTSRQEQVDSFHLNDNT